MASPLYIDHKWSDGDSGVKKIAKSENGEAFSLNQFLV